MEVDITDGNFPSIVAPIGTDASQTEEAAVASGADPPRATTKPPTLVATTAKSSDMPALDIDKFFPVFWSLQANFSAPTRLFERQHFESFKSGLQATLDTFQRVTSVEAPGITKPSDEIKKGPKRKRPGNGEETTSNFNPKYLTSRELFDLEVSKPACLHTCN